MHNADCMTWCSNARTCNPENVVENTLVIYDDKFDRLDGITCKQYIQGQDVGYNLS